MRAAHRITAGKTLRRSPGLGFATFAQLVMGNKFLCNLTLEFENIGGSRRKRRLPAGRYMQ